ncbi:MAG: sigma-54 dependent transcriptional regulator [Chiayiivirga sp.]|jgi:DNA-binding NtrC family response regulator|uniref:Sigma-54 dependent transcriptional regulator n=1 Tax=Denitratimonas tolerans TaxID=1338420 RepID=A0AAW9R5G6_9GAMM|nr:sigma-54 dependent transcriptional regulator [Xanthomonadaceae bacterium]MDX9763841.1 sigma-54 dependent transcriptional regulator [Chiayiivirga sp.]HRO87634.1 sigma-54 dependent transcriptional regulator [Chiayiivirga sp.]
MSAARILIIDDEPDIRSGLADILGDEGHRVTLAGDAAEARARLGEAAFDAVLLDIWMPGTDGLALLREWVSAGELPQPVIMMSGHGTVETAVEATRLGAYDFIEKPIALAKLLITLERALEAQRLRQINRSLQQQVGSLFEPMGSSPAFAAVLAQLERLSGRDAAILLRGEPGTGKEALARWLHGRSARRGGPFVTVAAGAVPDEQAATALFGSESGGEVAAGLLEQAQGGTVYLDGIAELGPDTQLRLSSALERRQILRVGGRAPVPLDVRVIAASSQDLEAERAAGRLRDELYFQLNVLPIQVPALRERGEDIGPLVQHFDEIFAARDGVAPRRWTEPVLARLRQHAWPGNVRELRALAQRLALLGSGEVTLAEVEPALTGPGARLPPGTGESGHPLNLDLPLREARDSFERAYLLRQLHNAGGSVGRLAQITGMERTHLYRKLRDLGIDKDGGE